MKQKTRRRLQNVGVIILIGLGLAWVGVKFWGFTSSTFTDNAQVIRRIVPVTSRVQGFVKEIRFDDFTPVKKGDTLVLIEDDEYRLNLAQARANLKGADVGRVGADAGISTTLNNASAQEAAIRETEALLENTLADERRYSLLLERKAVTQQQYDAIVTKRVTLEAQLERLKRQRESTLLASKEQTTRLGQSDAGIEAACSAVDLASLHLSYTAIVAPCDGWCSRRDIEPGQLVQPGQVVTSIVSAKDVWVIANYKERQTARFTVGDSVNIHVDAVPGIEYHGVVTEIANATGAAFSHQAPDNATGNFVKVQQRIPVKIRFTASNSAADLEKLRSGMNVECKILP